MLESIKKLREIADELDNAAAKMSEHGFSPVAIKAILQCDAIEREISERYMLLPVDADGVPIRIGDTVKGEEGGEPFMVEGFTSEFPNGEGGLLLVDERDDCFYAETARHANPRTIEDVLQERIGDVLSVMAVGEPVSLEAILNDSFGKECADELRELLGGDAE